MTKTKIIILVRILWTAGAPKKAIREAKELSNLGHDVKLIFLRKSETLKGYVDLLKDVNYEIVTNHNESILVPVYDYLTGFFAPDRKGEGRLDYNLLRLFPKYISKNLPDYIICHDQFSGLAGYYAKKRFNIPYSVLVHERVDSDKNGILKKFLYYYMRRVFSNACSIIASTEKIADSVRDQYHIDCSTNYQGFDKSEFTLYSNKSNVLMAVSMWDAGRKPITYLDVIEKIPSYKLYMVGNWRSEELYEYFCSEIRKRNLNEKVVMFRNISEKELNSLYDQAKFVIRFGFGELGESHAFFEGLQRGTPIIINSDLGTSHLARKYGVGLVIDKIEVSTIIGFLEEYDNEEYYAKLQHNISQIVCSFTWERHAKGLLCNSSSFI